MNLFKIACLVDGSPGEKWFLILILLMQDGLSNKEVMLGGLTGSVQIIVAAIPGFALHILGNSNLPNIVSHIVANGFPNNATLDQWYYKVKARRNFNQNSRNGSQPDTTVTPRVPDQGNSKGYNDDAEYTAPNKMNVTIRVSGDANIKEAIEMIVMDLEDSGIKIRWKPHQSKESMTQVVIIGVPRVFCTHGTAKQICHYLKEM